MKRNEIERLLPLIFQRTLGPETILHGLLQVMDDLHAPAEAVLSDIETTWLFAMIWAVSKSFHNRLVSVFSGCVHFATQTPGVESV